MSKMSRKPSIISGILFVITLGILMMPTLRKIRTVYASIASTVSSPFTYKFSTNGTLEEASISDGSTSPYFWLKSGALMPIANGVGMTNQGNLSPTSKWYSAYALSDPIGTDNGAHPQNVFQLMTRSNWRDVSQSIYANVAADNLSNVLNQHPYNGISLLSRYIDENNYYYMGIRDDGAAVIKKKLNGKFSTLTYTSGIFNTSVSASDHNFISKNTWIGLRGVVQNNTDGTISLKLYSDIGRTGTWKLIASTTDDGVHQGPVISSTGLAGIRSDFMDVNFDDYSLVDLSSTTSSPTPTPTPLAGLYGLNTSMVVQEAGSAQESNSPDWWLNSGAYFSILNGTGSTVQGSLPTNDPWRLTYAQSNPVDTDNGYHPQNIFRLVTQKKSLNYLQEAYFKITADNFSSSPNRDGYNGLLFFNRYQDSQNLYYAGIRTDGTAVIKKKINSTYYTMTQPVIFSGTYNHTTNPSLLPHNVWIGLRTKVITNSDGTVDISMYMDQGRTGVWTLIAHTVDDGKSYGGAPFTTSASTGIRTDFMDVLVEGYRIVAL